MNTKLVSWILRVSVAGEFIGHGVFALQGKADWIKWIGQLIGTDPAMSSQLLLWVGALDIAVALIILIRPIPIVLLWATFWGFWTALVRPLVGLPVWDFIERWANWGAPLALLLLIGWPKTVKGWFK
ncbi:MAG: hypothetical protein A3B25_01325 [Candidatus Ryanbacteria bacterium RIFCSPLOWO2_01_FULL_48_26]|uniref:DoxX family protein n=1 Tax=Candidatus Ryanbacteria bacterium RIFCSPLOWO2_01_FULL_48_26 TaxID=1802126 RepID=A0A1G2GV18_9BACT|nr:MAG: hypothetical protein A3B25_01325 [Candidatus Ryanbacteria bacterium RIFCSPLOWO2_01_FULL_48_26]OHB21538.1 MAG: hypothetical protein A3J67_04080 [Parcubacteria group bacterium RIFCSPHIGHO2_02_FULL_48_10b]